MTIAMLIVFMLGYTLIALEHKIQINKTAIALTLGVILWTLYIFQEHHTLSVPTRPLFTIS